MIRAAGKPSPAARLQPPSNLAEGSSMGEWHPERIWQSVRRQVEEWMGVDDSPEAQSNEDEADPTMLFHLSVTAPIVIALLILMRRAL